ncbi:MAG: right-handed parallel beta-helix repeat-containing protein [Deltaproteobacteria bacterium]|nr:MAG: right-handed parallel beta-helix repeat-containing protein [Deltaproteobacteria bacterium]
MCEGYGPAVDESGVTSGTIAFPHPTMEHITILWPIEGDTNENAEATVRYRPVGEGTWREGPPLFRAVATTIQAGAWENRFAGSLFGLEPDTEYEVEVTVSDPDGGCAVEATTVRTRAVPAPPDPGNEISATPATVDGVLASAGPGDIVVLEPGTYGEIVVPSDGAEGNPLVLRGTPGAVVQGDVRLDGRSDVIVEGLSIYGKVKFNGGTRIAVVRNRIETTEDGIVTYTRAEDAYIADNVVLGATVWAESSLGVDGDNVGEGIAVTGPGHVIEHNRVAGFRDAISLLEDGAAEDQFSIDILRNDVSVAADDGVEADFCFHDCRVLENRLTNTFVAISSQPSLGGPMYVARNVIYNCSYVAFKLYRESVGDVLWHNTVVKNGDAFAVYSGVPVGRTLSRNNLFLGGPGGTYGGYDSGQGRVLYLPTAYGADLDYDGVGSETGTIENRIGDVVFATFDELVQLSTEQHAVLVDRNVFATPPAYPSDPMMELAPPDLQLAPEGPAVDAGVPLPGYAVGAGAAPDLGAYEVGTPPPTYGPRP